ncbi:hypothetical protein [Streptomyces phaeoluteigriseus]|uniref:hypothetical protein n=1 Tax=Streptomyces phaeoluteigriseus TaxID=114686 RepID=UPI001B86C87C|nr:hypothetical protein [Streptomyces phaeoluteigriseus]
MTGGTAFDDVYRQAQARRVVFVAIERQGQRWTVKADTLTAGPGHTVDARVGDAARDAVRRLVLDGEVRSDAYVGPVYFVLHGVQSEARAREIAAALHATLYGDPEPLTRACSPGRSFVTAALRGTHVMTVHRRSRGREQGSEPGAVRSARGGAGGRSLRRAPLREPVTCVRHLSVDRIRVQWRHLPHDLP